MKITGEKRQKLIVSSVATAVLLLVFLVLIMIYQMVVIKQKEKQIAQGEQEIARLLEEQKQLEEGIDLWLTEFKIVQRAREIGYKLNDK